VDMLGVRERWGEYSRLQDATKNDPAPPAIKHARTSKALRALSLISSCAHWTLPYIELNVGFGTHLLSFMAPFFD
jgi:hypothetical protein